MLPCSLWESAPSVPLSHHQDVAQPGYYFCAPLTARVVQHLSKTSAGGIKEWRFSTHQPKVSGTAIFWLIFKRAAWFFISSWLVLFNDQEPKLNELEEEITHRFVIKTGNYQCELPGLWQHLWGAAEKFSQTSCTIHSQAETCLLLLSFFFIKRENWKDWFFSWNILMSKRRWVRLWTCSGVLFSCTYDTNQRKKMGQLVIFNIILFQMKAGWQLPVFLALMAILNSCGFDAALPNSWQHSAKFGIWHPLFPSPSLSLHIQCCTCTESLLL